MNKFNDSNERAMNFLRNSSRWFQLPAALFILLLGGCASLPDNSGKQFSSAYPSPEDTSLGQAYKEASPQYTVGQSGFHPLPDGLDAFVARAALAQIAEHTVDSQYYMVHEDMVGILYMDQLLEAADRGVRVRFLLDDIDEGERDFKLALFDYHPNFEVRIFNPFGRNTGKSLQFLTGFGKQTRRAHNKSFTVDNIVTVLGGRNMGDEYFAADAEMGFADMDVIGVGPVARQVSASFDQYWNSSLSYPIRMLIDQQPTEQDYRAAREKLAAYVVGLQDSEYLQHLRTSTLASDIRAKHVGFSWADSNVYADPPEKLMVKTGEEAYQMFTDLKPYLKSAKKDLTIVSPYFVPGREGTESLVKLRESGVRVRVLTNSLSSTDVSIVHAGYSRYRKALLRGGVELYELNSTTEREDRKAFSRGEVAVAKTSLHAKEFSVDRKLVFIGSLNLDPRSIVQNTEIGVVIKSEALAEMLTDRFDQKIDQVAFKLSLVTIEDGTERIRWTGFVDGQKKTLNVEPFTSFWRRFSTGFLRIMPIESQI